jgi:hypothetical protein
MYSQAWWLMTVSYLGGRDQEDKDSKPTQAKNY